MLSQGLEVTGIAVIAAKTRSRLKKHLSECFEVKVLNTIYYLIK
jgi:hypothetical protein